MKVFGKRTGLVVGLSTIVAAALMAQTYQQTSQSQQTQQSGSGSASASSSASARAGGSYSGSGSANVAGGYQGSQSGRGSGSGSGSSISNMVKNARGTTFVIDYQLTGATDGETTRQALRAHNGYLKSFADSHTLILAGSYPEDNSEMAILIAPSMDGARSFADSDPAVQAGVLKSRVRAFNLTHDGTSGQMAAPTIGSANPSGLGAHEKKNHP